MQLQPSDALPKIMLARYYSAPIARFLSTDPADDTDLELPQSWNQYVYVLNNPLIFNDPDGRVVNYVGATSQDQADIKDLVDQTRAISPGVDATLTYFEGSTEVLNIGFGDAPDTATEMRVGQTASKYDKTSGDYKGSDVTVDKKDIDQLNKAGTKVDAKTVVIHEVVGHVSQDRQETLAQRKQITDKKAEKKAKKETKKERKRIPKKDRPDRLPKRM